VVVGARVDSAGVGGQLAVRLLEAISLMTDVAFIANTTSARGSWYGHTLLVCRASSAVACIGYEWAARDVGSRAQNALSDSITKPTSGAAGTIGVVGKNACM